MGTLKQQEKLRELLVMGRESAAHLHALLRDHGPSPAQKLAQKVQSSLDGMLCIVRGIPSSDTDSAEVTALGSPSSGERSCVDSGESGKRPASKDRRGGYKRRRNLDSRIQVSTTTEDGYAWRKYGQKVILKIEYPRCYYRCTQKNDQGCLAKKQVQIIAEGPQKFQTTYFGYHTCSNITKKPSDFISDSNPEEPHLISFEPKSSNTLSEQSHDPTSIDKLIPPMKEEVKEQTIRNSTDDMGLTFWPDEVMAYDEDEGMVRELCSSCGSASSYRDLGMEFLMNCSDFDNAFSC